MVAPLKQKAKLISDELQMCDGSRWHQGKLWFSDMPRGRVMCYDPKRRVLEAALQLDHSSGLGWDSKGRMYIAGGGHILRWDGPGKKPETLVDVRAATGGGANDLVTLPDGRCYAGGGRPGFVADPGREENPSGYVVTVDPDAKCRIAADVFRLANGLGIAPDGRLIVGETYGKRLSSFTIQPDGSLKTRKLWAELGEAMPDGFCFDSEGCIWVSSISTMEFIRVAEGGQVKDRVPTPDGWRGLSCVLGGADRRTLFMLTNTTDRTKAALWMTHVDVPGGPGFP